MLTGTADATWSGALTDGTGDVAVGSDTWVGRCATSEDTDATNPAELLAAAYASCLSMTAADALDEGCVRKDVVHRMELVLAAIRGEAQADVLHIRGPPGDNLNLPCNSCRTDSNDSLRV